MVIDGTKSEDLLIKYSIGVSAEDFRLLHRLGLIERAVKRLVAVTSQPLETIPAPLDLEIELGASQANPGRFAAVLTRLIKEHLGLAGMVLATSVDKAQTVDELQDIAQRVIAQISTRRGSQAGEDARRTLFG